MIRQTRGDELDGAGTHERKLRKLPTWDPWLALQWKAHQKQNIVGVHCPAPPGATVLCSHWDYTIMPCGTREVLMCCDESKRAPLEHRFAQTYASRIDQPCLRLFFVLSAAMSFVVMSEDCTNADAASPTQPTCVRIDDAYADWYRSSLLLAQDLIDLIYADWYRSSLLLAQDLIDLIAAVLAAKTAKYLRSILIELVFPPSGPTSLYDDTKVAVNKENENGPTARSPRLDPTLPTRSSDHGPPRIVHYSNFRSPRAASHRTWDQPAIVLPLSSMTTTLSLGEGVAAQICVPCTI